MSNLQDEPSTPKYSRLVDFIRDSIDSGKWSPGSTIPSERDLACQQGVSRITAQRAVLELVRLGILEHVPGKKGTFVRGIPGPLPTVGTRLVGVAIDDGAFYSDSHMIRGIEKRLWEDRCHTVICNSDRNFAKVWAFIESLTVREVDGVIFSPVIDRSDHIAGNRRILDLLDRHGIPTVLCDRSVPGVRCNLVSSNHLDSTRELTNKLAETGIRRFVVVRGLPCSSNEERLEGFRLALRDAGIAEEASRVADMDDNNLPSAGPVGETTMAAIETALGNVGAETGLIVFNSRLMNGVTRTLVRRGLPLGRFLDKPLQGQYAFGIAPGHPAFVSTQNKFLIGMEAARLLLHARDNPRDPCMRVAVEASLEALG